MASSKMIEQREAEQKTTLGRIFGRRAKPLKFYPEVRDRSLNGKARIRGRKAANKHG